MATASMAASPAPETVRQIAREVVQRPDYQLGPGDDRRATFWAWVMDVLWWLSTPLRALFAWLHGISPPLAWLVIVVLVVVLLALLGHIAYSIKQAVRRTTAGRLDELRTPIGPDPTVLERKAAEAVAGRDYIAAVRFLFRACLLRLAQSDRGPARRGTTNRELLRRYHSTAVFDSLQVLVETIDAKWYGRDVCDAADYERCALAHQQIRQATTELTHALRP